MDALKFRVVEMNIGKDNVGEFDLVPHCLPLLASPVGVARVTDIIAAEGLIEKNPDPSEGQPSSIYPDSVF